MSTRKYYRSKLFDLDLMLFALIMLEDHNKPNYHVYIMDNGGAYFESFEEHESLEPIGDIMAVPPTHPNPPERSIPNY